MVIEKFSAEAFSVEKVVEFELMTSLIRGPENSAGDIVNPLLTAA